MSIVMHLSIPEQTYPRKPVYVETQNKDGESMRFQGHLTYRANVKCVVQDHKGTWYCVPVEQVHPLQ